MKIHEKYMLRCITLAKKGLGTTYPNPLVGAIIVHRNIVIGEGWHYQAGLPHAEVNAIASVVDKSLLKEATLYVSLEPCSHFGKTPPCADLIIKEGIKRVVIGCTDPNPSVAGSGIKKLLDAGCEVITGILEEECVYLNKRFFSFHNKKRPYIFLKWAQSADGFIAPLKTKRKNNTPFWITSPYTRQVVHKTRSEEQAILVGTQTVLDDNPSLTTRAYHGTNPVRVIIDRSLKIGAEFSVFDNEAKTIIITERKKENTETVFYEVINFEKDTVQQICTILHKHQIQSVIIEGGTRTLHYFIAANVWDEAHIYSGSSIIETGIPAPTITGKQVSEKQINNDSLKILKNNSQ